MIQNEIGWIKKVLRVCAHIEEYSSMERQIVFEDINNEYRAFTDAQYINIKNILLSQLTAEDLIYVLSILYQNSDANQWLAFIIEVSNKLNLDIFQRSMLELQFKMTENCSSIDCLMKYHRKTVELWEDKIPIPNSYQPIEQRNAKRVVIVTEQLLRYEQHAPTKVILDMAYLLQKKMGYSVLIMTFPSNISNMIPIWYNAQRMLSLEDYNYSPIAREYKGETFWGYQTGMESMNIRDYSLALSYILEWNPLFVYSFGAVNPVVDLLTRYTTVVAQSMSTKLPVSIAQILISLEDEKKLSLEDGQKIVKFNRKPVYFEKEKRIHTRREYGLPENRFMCVIVGNRLETDVDEAFIEMINQLCIKMNNIAFVFIGKIGMKQEELKDKIPNAQMYFVDYCDDLLGIYKIMDLYINPKRQGGGYSAAMAIAAGLPVVTCDYGDVAYHVGQDFVVPDYEKMKQEIICYASNSVYKKEKINQAKEHAKYMTEDSMYQVMEENMKRLIDEVMSTNK